jgi:hypothetical protein
MWITFREGIVRTPNILTGPAWLAKTSLNATSVDLTVPPGSGAVLITFAHYEANYIYQEEVSVPGAWGNGVPGASGFVNNGALPTDGTNAYLYWDIDLGSGGLSRGWTSVPPIVTSEQPTNPVVDQHWFDLIKKRMRVFTVPSAGTGQWLDKIRVFAGIYNSQSALIVNSIGSQVGIVGHFQAGDIILGVNNKPLRQADGTFVTTASSLIIPQTSGQNVQLDFAIQFAQAAVSIPAFSLVSFLPNRTIGLASNTNFTNFVSGMVVENLDAQMVGQIIPTGVVRNDQWNWSAAQINAPIFLGANGTITLIPPTIGVVQQIGYIFDVDSIYLDFFAPIVQQPFSVSSKPLILGSSGIINQATDGAILNLGGTSNPTFTVGGFEVASIGSQVAALTTQVETLTSEISGAGNVKGLSYIQSVPSTTWAIAHDGGTFNVAVTIYDGTFQQIIPNSIQIIDNNNVLISFSSALSGRAMILLF